MVKHIPIRSVLATCEQSSSVIVSNLSGRVCERKRRISTFTGENKARELDSEIRVAVSSFHVLSHRSEERVCV